jgi:hypothetical protein
MFVRFRQAGHRLQASLIETRRIDGKVRHEHVASLGSVILPPSVADRITFWQRLHERLGKLSNRVNADTQAKVLGLVHARIPMVTADEQRALQIENAEADVQFWSGIRDMNTATAEDHKGLAAKAAEAITSGEVSAAQADIHAKEAADRIARIKRGEDVQGGLGRAITREDWQRELIAAGITREDLRRFKQVHEIIEAIGFDTFVKAIIDAKDRAERRIERGLHRLVRSRGR